MTNKPTYPLNALRAFEASARHLSFVGAAEELHVTPAAVSHQVKKLEAYLGAPLFRRLPRGLRLAEAGQAFYAELREVFLRLDKAMERVVESHARGSLTISVAPIFAVKWLLPRLQQFSALHPEIDIRMSSSVQLIDFHRDSFDAAIRFGFGTYPGLVSTRLFDEFVTPMCSPRVLDNDHALKCPDDLRHHVLLHDDSMAFDPKAPDWKAWLDKAGAKGVDASRGPHFSQPDHVLQAAIDGAGAALGWRYLAAADIAAGRLVAPFNLRLPLGSAFYLVHPEAYADRHKIKVFRNWLLKEVRSDLARLREAAEVS
jgi:LysR family glycine cleavage system transcriptional activator